MQHRGCSRFSTYRDFPNWTHFALARVLIGFGRGFGKIPKKVPWAGCGKVPGECRWSEGFREMFPDQALELFDNTRAYTESYVINHASVLFKAYVLYSNHIIHKRQNAIWAQPRMLPFRGRFLVKVP